MLSKVHRFHGYGSLRYVYKQGQVVRAPDISLKYLHNQRRKSYRCAIVISKKIEKSAVGRNRIRRRIYEIIREFGSQIQEPYDMVVTVSSGKVAKDPPEKIRDQIKLLLTKAKIIGK